MVNLGTGIGGGIVIDGQVQRGRYGIAGEFGHMQVVPERASAASAATRAAGSSTPSGNALVREARDLIVGRQPGR